MKNIKITDILYYLSFATVIIITVFFDRKYLVYALPVTIVSIGILYCKHIDKVNFWYVISLISMIICDILIYSDFVTYFTQICLLTSIYFIASTLVLRRYLLIKNIKRSAFLSIPILVSSALVAYLIYSISQLLIEVVRDTIPYIVICLTGSTTYILVAYLIYMQDVYKEGLKLIIVACLCIFIVALLPINELFYLSNIFTIFINIAHVLSLYIFMRFLIETTPEKVITNKEKYL